MNVLASDKWLAARGVEIHEINRGGDVTYHGPGQLVGYPIFDLRGEWPGKRGPGYRFLGPVDFVRMIEEALIRTCADFGVMAKRIPKCTGVWTFGGEESTGTEKQIPSHSTPQSGIERCGMTNESYSNTMCERKLAAIGVHVSQGVTSHGFALNVTTDLREFEWIIPCGITDRGVTSLEIEAPAGVEVTMEAAMHSSARSFGRVFARQMLWCESLEQLLEPVASRK